MWHPLSCSGERASFAQVRTARVFPPCSYEALTHASLLLRATAQRRLAPRHTNTDFASDRPLVTPPRASTRTHTKLILLCDDGYGSPIPSSIY